MSTDIIELVVAGITLDRNEENPRIILQSRGGEITLTLSTGPFEAGAIIVEMEKIKTPVPFTHDSFAGFLTRHGFRVDHILLHSFMVDTCLAKMVYRKGLRRYAVDIKPSDGIALALRMGAPLHVSASEDALRFNAGLRHRGGDDRSVLLLGEGKLNSSFLH
jgi:bifunctional DNase/RNase